MKLISSWKLSCAEQQVESERNPVVHTPSNMFIEKSGSLWCVRSSNPNDKNFGCYSSKEEAENRLHPIPSNLDAESQYGRTGWQYGQRTVGRETGYIPQRTVSGFPAPHTGGRGKVYPARPVKPIHHPVGKGTGFGVRTHMHPPKIVKAPNLGHVPKIHVPKPKFVGPQPSAMGKMPKASPMGRAPQLQAEMGEPMIGNMSHAHIDPVTWFRPPSLTQREKNNEEGRIPTDDPREKNDKFMDVTKRNSKDTIEQKYKLLKRSAPGGLPAQIPARTTALEPHQAFYMPLSHMFGSAQKKPRKLLKGSNFTSYTRRGCI